jgi:probable blue pigment (indigoidine) exporter
VLLESCQPHGEQPLELFRLRLREAVEQAPLIDHVLGEGTVDKDTTGVGQGDHARPAVVFALTAAHESGLLQAVNALRHRASGHHGVRSEFARLAFERLSGPPQRCQHVEFPFAEPEFSINDADLVAQMRRQAVQPPDHALRSHIHVGAFPCPFRLDAADVVEVIFHAASISSKEVILTSMEANFRWAAITAIAPVAWGTSYFVTHEFLPADYPLYGSIIRALPAGLLLLALGRRRPRGSWWWKATVLGTLTMGAFFALVYVAAQLLPTSIASTVMAAAPVVMMLFAWVLVAERPRMAQLSGAGIGIAGVCLMLLTAVGALDGLGLIASLAAMVMSSLGFVLSKRWSGDVDVLSLTSWQLIAGGAVLVPFAVALEGAPPALGASALLGFAYLSVVGTAAAFVAWFTGLRHLGAGTVGLIGLLNPVTGVLLGTLVAGELLSARQALGVALVLVGVLLGQPTASWALSRLRRRWRAWMSV